MLPLALRSSKTTPVDLAEYLGFSTDSVDDAVSYLAKVDSHLVIAAVNELNLNFRPCVEKEFDGVESFITQNWITADLSKIKNMPILIGFNSDESHWRHMSLEDEYYENVNLRDSLALVFNVEENEFKGMEDTIRHFYFGDDPMSGAVKRNVIDFDSDFTFVYPTYRSISKYLDYEAGNIYFYVFSYSGERNYFKDFFNYTGATHSDELGYLFDISYMKDKPVTPEDEIIINQMTTMWTNFVKYGDPTPQTSDLIEIQWTPIKNLSQIPYLNIDAQLSLGGRPFHRRVTFWDLFYRANNDNLLTAQNPSEI
ncbi:unnamed protein product [Arctia plantaginis]|uniref:Carboxylesterase type B domain-containing protein n=1 Tax=Arctia plantaginis TaxID=874455 RepID=A0A8S1B8Y1_ARCPL|nr:unnamed protein product [Arctia plantaginis]